MLIGKSIVPARMDVTQETQHLAPPLGRQRLVDASERATERLPSAYAGHGWGGRGREAFFAVRLGGRRLCWKGSTGRG